jgi:hypothetical protein
MLEQNIGGSNLSLLQLIIVLFIFIIFLVIGFVIEDKNLKISYWLSVGLGVFTIINIYLTITYYMDLRTRQGERGPKGLKGELGGKGDPGNCVFREKCEIADCEDKIKKELNNNKNLFNNIEEKCYLDPSLENCDNNDEKLASGQTVNKIYNDLVKKCKQNDLDEEDFINKLKTSLVDL